MIYKSFQELSLSTLGMGTMRLPVSGDQGIIDETKARELIEYAYENGVNYFDTAYRYHGGESEKFIGRTLRSYPRSTWYLASKMPGHMMNYQNGKLGFQGYLAGEAVSSPAAIFEEQLEKCGVDYFDFYLLHNVCETSYDFYTNAELGVVDYLVNQKKAGRIRHFGFSAHGRAETIEKFLLHYPGYFEFGQIQLNYMDWTLQEAGKKYDVLTRNSIPVIVMEPCRGGSLASVPAEAEKILRKARPRESVASWAFRFLQSLPNVQVVLSGMTTMDQLKENIALFSKDDPITKEQQKLLNQVVAAMADLIPCTACRYCCEDCPQKLNIPQLISMYSELKFSGNMGTLAFTINAMKDNEMPSACLECGACAAVCPQGIDVPRTLKEFAAALEKEH